MHFFNVETDRNLLANDVEVVKEEDDFDGYNGDEEIEETEE